MYSNHNRFYYLGLSIGTAAGLALGIYASIIAAKGIEDSVDNKTAASILSFMSGLFITATLTSFGMCSGAVLTFAPRVCYDFWSGCCCNSKKSSDFDKLEKGSKISYGT